MLDSAERLSCASALNFVVILAYPVFFRSDVYAPHHVEQNMVEIAFFSRNELLFRLFFAEIPDSFQVIFRVSFVEEFHFEVCRLDVVVVDFKVACVSVFADDSDFDFVDVRDLFELFIFFFRNRHRHALLSLGNEDFPRLKALIFERNFFKVYPCSACILRHLTDARAESAGTVIGNSVEKVFVARFENEIEHSFLNDGITYLNCRNGASLVKLLAAEGRTVNTVFSDSSARHNDEITCFSLFFPGRFAVEFHRHESARSAENERFAEITVIKVDGAVYYRDSAFITAVFDSSVDAAENSSRMKEFFRNLAAEEGACKAENIGVKNRFRPHSAADDVAVYADDTGECAAVRVKCARRVVGLDFHREKSVVINLDDTCVVVED